MSAREPQPYLSTTPDQDGSGGASPGAPDPASSHASAAPDFGGPFRQVFLVWFEHPDARRAVEWLGRAVEVSVRAFGTPDIGPERRVRVIAAELDALSTFLIFGVDGRERSELKIPDWELARLAHEAGASLATWADSLRAAIGDLQSPSRGLGSDHHFGVRETALWPAEESELAYELREICRMLFGFNREIGLREAPANASLAQPEIDPESSTRRDVRAAAQDLLHLASFATATTADLPSDDSLQGSLSGLSYRLARMVETLCAGVQASDPAGG